MSYYDKDRTDNTPHMKSYPGPGLGAVGEYQQAGRPFLQVAAPANDHENNGVGGTEAFTANDLVKGDDVTVTFPFITKRVTIKNLHATNDAYIYFCSLRVPVLLAEGEADGDAVTQRGNKVTDAEIAAYVAGGDTRPESAVKANGHYYTLAAEETIEMNVKCRRIYIAGNGNVRVYGELTNIVHDYNCDLRGIDGISGDDAGTVTS